MSRRSRGRGAVDLEKLSIAKIGAPRAVHPDTILVVWEGFHHNPRLVPMLGGDCQSGTRECPVAVEEGTLYALTIACLQAHICG